MDDPKPYLHIDESDVSPFSKEQIGLLKACRALKGYAHVELNTAAIPYLPPGSPLIGGRGFDAPAIAFERHKQDDPAFTRKYYEIIYGSELETIRGLRPIDLSALPEPTHRALTEFKATYLRKYRENKGVERTTLQPFGLSNFQLHALFQADPEFIAAVRKTAFKLNCNGAKRKGNLIWTEGVRQTDTNILKQLREIADKSSTLSR